MNEENDSEKVPNAQGTQEGVRWAPGDVGWGFSVVPVIRLSNVGVPREKRLGREGGSNAGNRILGGKVERRLRPSQRLLGRWGRRERRARVCREREAHRPEGPLIHYLFPENMGPRITYKRSHLKGFSRCTPRSSHHPTPTQTPHLDLPPGLAGGDGQHGRQIDVTHGGCANLSTGVRGW